MKKFTKITIIIIVAIFAIFEIISVIYGLIYNTTETFIWLGGMTASCLTIYGCCWLHILLEKKQRINWMDYPELKIISRWICFSSWLFISLVMEFYIFNSHHLMYVYDLIIYSAFSFYTYFSLMFARKNALFLLRSYLTITMIMILINTNKICQKPIEIIINNHLIFNNLCNIFGLILVGLIIALCIKGLIITLKPKIRDLFKDYNVSYLQIVIVTLIFIGMIRMRNTIITFSNSENSSSEKIEKMK